MTRGQDLLFTVGRPLGPVYGLVMLLRQAAYGRGVLASHRLPVPVVSVGNLTWGGTGKTPMVAAVVRHLQRHGRRPAVVSRGHGGRHRHGPLVVSRGDTPLVDAATAGDEPRLLAELLPGTPVVVGRRRPEAARLAVAELGADCIVLDDGFQHLALARDVDVVLFNSRDPLGNGRVCPAGPLREPLAALVRASCFVACGGPLAAPVAALLARRFPLTPLFQAERLTNGPVPTAGPPPPAGSRAVLACGIGDPDGFRLAAERLGVEVVEFFVFADHHPYDDQDRARLAAAVTRHRAHYLLTTGKDLVRLGRIGVPVQVLELEVVPEEGFWRFLDDRLRLPC